MDYRKDILPPVCALLLSGALHLALFRIGPLPWFTAPPQPDEVVLQYLVEEAALEPPPTADAATRQAAPEAPPAPAPPAPKPPNPAVAAPKPPNPSAAAPKPPNPAVAARQAKAAPPPVAPEPPDPRPARAAPSPTPPPAAAPLPEPRPLAEATPQPPAPEPLPAVEPAPAPSQLPSLGDLLPRAGDVPAQAGPLRPPDPSGEAREATLALGDTDARYRSYLERVKSAIDLSWKWKEALLAAGRAGGVLVRFTLLRSGEVEAAEVAESSGSPVLDREAVDAVKRAPAHAFPGHWTIEKLHLLAQFDYRFE